MDVLPLNSTADGHSFNRQIEAEARKTGRAFARPVLSWEFAVSNPYGWRRI
jgi:hypothetical protein